MDALVLRSVTEFLPLYSPGVPPLPPEATFLPEDPRGQQVLILFNAQSENTFLFFPSSVTMRVMHPYATASGHLPSGSAEGAETEFGDEGWGERAVISPTQEPQAQLRTLEMEFKVKFHPNLNPSIM